MTAGVFHHRAIGPEMPATPLAQLLADHEFTARHVGPDSDELARMLSVLEVASVDELLDQTIPTNIRDDTALALPPARSEAAVLAALRELADRNGSRRSLIGMGYTPTITPGVIQRIMLESPAW